LKKKILLLAGNTFRAKAYAQYLSKFSDINIDVEGLFYGLKDMDNTAVELDSVTRKFLFHKKLFIPNLNEDIRITFKKNNWPFTELITKDANSNEVLEVIKKSNVGLVVFAGYGGQILKKPHFETGKKYLHMHPGDLPMERGSTTIYYSILNKRHCTVTAFFMSEKIDAGENIIKIKYKKPYKDVNIDIWYDNVIRANCFIEALKILDKDDFVPVQPGSESEEYYVIHPVLKHIALLSLQNTGQ
jgi:folate-dependent phosphoribosylglycinamide formyltransferase PurN